jgi:mRNA interferase RelE/StbE
MASFEIQWRGSTRKDLRKLPRKDVARVVAQVETLASEPFPHGTEKLSGAEHTYRIRVGDYRVIYEVWREVRVVLVQRVRHRSDVYRS